MKPEDQYLKFVLWSAADQLYVGYCPDLFPWGGVCHASTEGEAYSTLCDLVREEVGDLSNAGKELPRPSTRPMREAVPG
jgi:hypothetical protein